MAASFRFSAPVSAWLVVLLAVAVAIALLVPTVSIPLAMGGALSTGIIWFKVAFRTRKWIWWEFGVEPLTPVEGIVAVSGVVLFAAGFVTVLGSMARNAT
jgi:hypothetical protein